MSPDLFFENIFNRPRVTNDRLTGFADDVLGRVALLDTVGKYAALADRIAACSKTLHDEITGVDRHINSRLGKSGKVGAATQVFRDQMSELEGAIAYQLGGRSGEAYLAFYPAGLTEYRTARMTQIPTLLDRVYDAAATYADRLDAGLKERLQGFRAAWHAARADQAQAKGAVSGSRAVRNTARHNLEIALLALVHTIALDHAENPGAGKAWFDFSLLEPAAHPSRRRPKDDGEVPRAA